MSYSEILLNIIFYTFAFVAAVASLWVALSRNIVRSAFALFAVLFSAAVLYALMKSDFIFAVQILVYVGGILVLIIFAIMLTHKIIDVNVSNESAPTPVALFVVLSIFGMLLLIALRQGWSAIGDLPSAWKGLKAPLDQPLTEKIGEALMNQYLYPFEIISVLLLACLIGAAYLARKEVK